MKKLSHLLLLPIALLAITGCNNGKQKTNKEVVDEIINSPALLMHDVETTGSSNLIPSNTKFSIRDGYSYLGMSSYEEYQDAKFVWSFDKADKWTVAESKASGDYQLLTPESDLYVKGDVDPSYDTVLTLTVSYKEESATVSWRAHYTANRIIQISLPELRNKIKKKQANIGNVYELYAYVTNWFNNPNTGLFIQDGESALCIYDDKKTDLPATLVKNGLAKGNIIRTVGHYDVTGGLTRFIPSELEVVETAPFDLEEPTKVEVTAENYSIAGLNGQDSRLGIANDLVFKTVYNVSKKEVTDLDKLKAGTSFFIGFEATDAQDQKTEILFNCNTYLGKDLQNELIAMVKTWTADVTKVSVDGLVYFSVNYPYLIGFSASCITVE